MAYLAGGALFLFFALALYRIWGPKMLKDVLLSPVRRYDFDED